MAIGSWFGTRRARQGASAGVVVLATGGLFLLHANAAATPTIPTTGNPVTAPIITNPLTGPGGMLSGLGALPPAGPDTVTFDGPHVHGSLAVSDARAMAGAGQPFYADVTLTADAAPGEHAPLALVVVLDTSGSMEGEKLREAKSAVKELVRGMRDDDDVALVHYASTAEVLVPLVRVGAGRGRLNAAIDGLTAGGGTAIPLGLRAGVEALESGLRAEEHSASQRVRRIVLVSDGLDSSRPASERLAHSSADTGVTVSSMGIGLDFDEAYMGGIARAGHGNFGFVNDGPTLATFLKHELVETATTVAESTVVHLHLPEGVRFVKATGADADVHGKDVDLKVGALYADDAKKVLLTLSTDLRTGTAADFAGSLTWHTATGTAGEATIPQLRVIATDDAGEVAKARNATVMARVTSVVASDRQFEATQAYANGDTARASGLIQQNMRELQAAAAAAPAPAASALAAQSGMYEETMKTFHKAAPMSIMGRSAVKASAARDLANAGKAAF
jgi:Ca-activated chloride channel family protein